MSDHIIFLQSVTRHRPITLKGNVWGITPPPFNADAKGVGMHPTPTPAVPRGSQANG
jgi:hypothetical protein